MHYKTSVQIMARLKFFLIAVVALVSKDGALSCSLQSHKSLCSSNKTNTISIPHHSSAPRRLSTTPPPCGSSTTSRSCSPNASVNPSNDLIPSSKPTSSSESTLPVPASTVPPKLTVASDHSKTILNLITKLLSSSVGIGPSVSQIPHKPTSNTVQVPVLAPKPCTIPRTCDPLSILSPASSGSSNVLLRLPYGLGPSSTVEQVPSQPVSTPAPSISPTNLIQTSSVRSDLLNFFLQLLSIASGTKVPLVSKLKPLSPPCPIVTPALNNDAEIVTPSKPVTTTFNCTPIIVSGKKVTLVSNIKPLSLPCPLFKPALNNDAEIVTPSEPVIKTFNCTSSFGSSPSSNGMPLISTLPPKITVPEPVPEEFPAQVPTSNTTSPQAPAAILMPVSAPTSAISIVTGQNNSAIINLLIKCLLSSRAPTGEPVSLKSNSTSPCSLFTSTINKTQLTPTLKPQTTPAACATTSGSKSCSSSALPSFSSVSIVSPNLTSVSPPSSVPVPTSTSDITSGYNPNFIKLLIKQLLSNHPTSLPAPLDIPFPTKLNTTPVLPPKPTFPMPISNRPLSELNNNLFGALLNKSYDLVPKSTPSSTPVPITNPNISISNNSAITNILCKGLSPPFISLKTPPCLPLLSSHPVPTLNIPVSPLNPKPLPTSIPCTSSLPLTDTVPVPNTSPPAVVKPFPEPNQNVNVDIVLKPTLRPHLCHLKHSRLIHPTSSSSDTTPHIKHILRSHTSSSPLPCSKPSRLGSGCKHLPLI